MVFNPGPEVAGNRGAEGATAHYSWRLAGMLSDTDREGYALSQALGTLEVDRLRLPQPNAVIYTGSTTQMIKLQRRLGIAAGKIAHESGEIEGETGVRHIGERLYDFATNPESFIDKNSGDPLPFHRAIGAIALPFAEMLDEDGARAYFNTDPASLGMVPHESFLPLAASPNSPVKQGYRGRNAALNVSEVQWNQAVSLALVDDTSPGDQYRHAWTHYWIKRINDSSLQERIAAARLRSNAIIEARAGAENQA